MTAATTLCRLAFQVLAEEQGRFSTAWNRHLQTLLAEAGLVDGRPCERILAEDVVAYVFTVESTAQIGSFRSVLQGDPGWSRALREAGLVTDEAWSLDLYRAPIRDEPAIPVGGGTRSGPWLGFDAFDGMPSVLINDITTGADGCLLLATYEGICRFDGATTGLLTPADGVIQWIPRLLFDHRRGVLWFSQVSPGLARLDEAGIDIFTHADGLTRESTAAMCLSSCGDLWIARGEGGCTRFDGERFVPADAGLPGDTPILDMLADRDGGLVLGTTAGVYRRRENGSECIGLRDERVSAVCEDAEGRLWVGASSGIYLHGPGGFERHEALSTVGPVIRLTAGREGGLWVSSRGNGAVHWDGETVRAHTAGSGLSSSQVNATHVDERGCVWVGAWGGGLSRYDGDWVGTIAVESGLPAGRVETLCDAGDGSMWIGTWGGGLFRARGEEAERVPGTEEVGDFLWSSCRDREGRFWFGTFGQGVVCLDGERLSRLTTADGLGHDSVWGIHQDHSGRMWFATQGGGLTCFDGDRCITYTTADGLPHNQVWSVAEDAEGAIWCSTVESGVSRFDGKSFRSYSTKDGLAHDQVWCILPDRGGDLWFGTWGGGVSRFDGKGFTTYTTRDGLAHNSIRSMCQSADGHLWFGTFGGGACRYDGLAFQAFSRREGLVHDAVQHIEEGSDGRMWIATEAGVTRYAPPEEPPRVELRGVVADQRYAVDDVVTLGAAQRLVTVEFSGASFSTAYDRLVYAYRILGQSEEWRTTTRRRVELPDLPVGSYTFEVQAIDRDLNYSTSAAVKLAIEPDAGSDRLRALEAELGLPGSDQLVGRSPALRRVLVEIDTVAASDLTVLILGETGTGKGLAARAIHSLGAWSEGPFLQVNCGAIPEGLVESELFGHEKGAFTGAVSRRIGGSSWLRGGRFFLMRSGTSHSSRSVCCCRCCRTVSSTGSEDNDRSGHVPA